MHAERSSGKDATGGKQVSVSLRPSGIVISGRPTALIFDEDVWMDVMPRSGVEGAPGMYAEEDRLSACAYNSFRFFLCHSVGFWNQSSSLVCIGRFCGKFSGIFRDQVLGGMTRALRSIISKSTWKERNRTTLL